MYSVSYTHLDVYKRQMLYNGIDSCKAANLIFAGQNKCSYGCLGFGDCQKACPYGAITICDGVAPVSYTHLDVYKRQAFYPL